MEYFDVEKIIISLFIDSAKGFTDLSTGALVLSVVFHEKVLGQKSEFKTDRLMIISWLFFLFTIITSTLYQYTAIKFLKIQSGFPGGGTWFPNFLIDNPGRMYAVMMICFLLGACFFSASAISKIINRT